jgi:antitoxin ParD1/3/4
MKSNTQTSTNLHVKKLIQQNIKNEGLTENSLLTLRQAIQEGINSGIATDFDPKQFLNNLKEKGKSSQP